MRKIALVSGGLYTHTGGPSIVIASLARKLTENNISVKVISPEGEIHPSILDLQDLGIDVVFYRGFGKYKFSLAYLRKLSNILGEVDVVWVHGLFQWPCTSTLYFNLFYRKTLILTPHGVLTKDMLRHKYLKKILLGWFDFLVILMSRNTVHFLSEDEKSRSLRVYKHCFIAPNLVVRKEFPNPHNGKFCFIGRLVEIKGVSDLIAIEGQSIDFFGHDQDGYSEKLEKHPMHRYYGVLGHDDVGEMLSRYEVFILPSYAEGLPTSAIEAALSGRILLISHNCNLDELRDGVDCIKFSPGVSGIRSGLERFRNMNASQRKIMAENCSKNAMMHYGESAVTNKYLNVVNGSIHK